jgi:UDP-2,4-diacetamido-2,4,6-trideoxy-beta-L-altropyranose hydrolase
MLNVAIRTDASLHIGSGHVMRCLVLADALKNVGYNVVFLTRPQKGDLINIIKLRGFHVCELSQPVKWLVPETTSDYAAWLQMDENNDAEECIARFEPFDLVIVDHYGIGIKWHKKVKKAYNCKIMVIDDLVRQHDADLIVDQTLLRNVNEHQKLNPAADILAGTDYAIIHPDFAKHHSSVKSRELTDRPNILLSMGGVDSPNATLQVLAALKQDFKVPPFVTVLLSEQAPHYQQVKSFAKQEKSWVTHIDFVENMAEFMSGYDIAIGAPGSTSWERACLGIPSIIIALADNQLTICKKLGDIGAAISVDIDLIDKDLKRAYLRLLADYNQMKVVNLKLCDGLGVNRIMDRIQTIFEYSLQLRFATLEDIQQVFEWQCVPQTRCYALNKDVPSLPEHQDWMTRKIASHDDYFYIIELKAGAKVSFNSVGVVRLDLAAKNTYTISIFIAPTHFGKGIAKQALALLDRLHPNIVINAVVLKENVASQALFSRAGYMKIDEEIYTRQPVA